LGYGSSNCQGSFQQPAGGVGQTCDNSPPSPAVYPTDDDDDDDSASGSKDFVSAQQANMQPCATL
jgi:hypothetical protein